MALTVYQYPNCSTCRRALKWLDERKLPHERVHIVEAPPSATQLKHAMERAKLPVKALFNTAGESYRAGNFKERLATMTEGEALAALAKDGKLIKRPLVLGDGAVLVGFDEQRWASALG